MRVDKRGDSNRAVCVNGREVRVMHGQAKVRSLVTLCTVIGANLVVVANDATRVPRGSAPRAWCTGADMASRRDCVCMTVVRSSGN